MGLLFPMSLTSSFFPQNPGVYDRLGTKMLNHLRQLGFCRGIINYFQVIFQPRCYFPSGSQFKKSTGSYGAEPIYEQTYQKVLFGMRMDLLRFCSTQGHTVFNSVDDIWVLLTSEVLFYTQTSPRSYKCPFHKLEETTSKYAIQDHNDSQSPIPANLGKYGIRIP